MCSQRSLEDEINRTTIQDLPIFAISYIVIFVYISLALGSYSRCDLVLVRAGHRAPDLSVSSKTFLTSSS